MKPHLSVSLRITELSHLLQAEQRQREGKEQEMKKHLETERSLQSVSQGVIRLVSLDLGSHHQCSVKCFVRLTQNIDIS